MIEKAKGKSNVRSIFGAERIPSDAQVRNLLDEQEPELLYGVFEKGHELLAASDQMETFRSYAGQGLISCDGTGTIASQQIHCPNCSRRDGKFSNTAVHIVLGVDLEGYRDVLGHWVADGEEGAITLNLLAFLFHILLDLPDEQYQALRRELVTRQDFFNDLRALLRYMLFDNWNHLMHFMLVGLELIPDT
jgi:hypothetical protein